MNATCAIVAEDDTDWATLKSEANLWRGRMIDHYAAVEHAITETLIHLRADCPSKKLPHLAGQRREAVRIGLAAHSAGDHAKGVLDALARFERLIARRTYLCHGLGRVLVDHRGHWFLHLRLLAPHDDPEQIEDWVIGKSDAEALLQRLSSASRRVVDRLANFRRSALTASAE